MKALAPKVEKAVPKPRFFGVFNITKYRQRQFLGNRLNLDLLDADFDLTCRKLAVHRFVGARDNWPRDGYDPFGTAPVSFSKGWRVRLDHTLGHAVVVSQIDKDQPAVVAPAMNPTGQAHALTDGFFPQLAAGVAPIGVHHISFKKLRKKGRYVAGWHRLGQDRGAVTPLCKETGAA